MLKLNRPIAALAAAALATTISGAFLPGIAMAAASKGPKATPTQNVTWSGLGTHVADGLRTLDTEVCGIANGAPVDGDYLQFVLASTKSITGSVTIQFGADTPVSMTKSNTDKRGTSSYKYLLTPNYGVEDVTAASASDFLNELLALPVQAAWVPNGTPTFTLGQGCIDGYAGTGWVDNLNLSVSGSLNLYCVAVVGCGIETNAIVGADGNSDDTVVKIGLDIFDIGSQGTSTPIPFDTFDYAKITAVALYQADGTKLGDMTWGEVTEGMYAYVDNTFLDTALYAVNGVPAYVVVTYDGVEYKYAIPYGD